MEIENDMDKDGFLVNRSSYFKRLFITGGVTLSGIVLFILMIPTMFILVYGGPSMFFFKREYEFESPDAQYSMKIYRRMDFPADSFIDPSATLSVVLERQATSEVIADKRVFIHEYPELSKPELEWSETRVRVTHIESHRDTEFEISLNSRLPL